MTERQIGAAPAQAAFEYFVDADEIAFMLKLDPKTVQKMAREGIIPAYPFGEGPRKTWRFLPSEVHEWMRTRVHSEGHPCRSNRRKPN
jgi:excisionase family DNA binding protein